MRILSRSWRPSLRLALIVAALAALSATFGTGPASAARPSIDVAACQLPARTGWLDEGFPTDFDIFLEPDGMLQAVMLFVDFPDAPIGDADGEWQSVESYLELHEPGADWLRTAPYGGVDVDITAIDKWYRMSQPSTAYG